MAFVVPWAYTRLKQLLKLLAKALRLFEFTQYVDFRQQTIDYYTIIWIWRQSTIFWETLRKNDDVIVIFVKWITRGGKRIYASSYGLKAFRLEIPKSKYRG